MAEPQEAAKAATGRWRRHAYVLVGVVALRLMGWFSISNQATNKAHGRPFKQQQRRNRRGSIPWNGSFAACMLWKDDNHHLIEWLAYHYQRLPLRRVIIGLDPTARTHVAPIVHRYNSRGLMNITVWQDEDYMPIALLDRFNKNKTSAQDHVDLHVARQVELYRHCMLQLLSEDIAWSWTTFFDVDEFLTSNPFVRPQVSSRHPRPSWSLTLFQWIQKVKSDPDLKSRYKQPCFAAPRVIYGAREDKTLNQSAPPVRGFHPQDFLTYRWKYCSEPQARTGMHKSIVNLEHARKIDVDLVEHLLHRKNDPVYVHQPIEHHCRKQEMFQPSPSFMFRLNHYMGSREQYFFRQDFRAAIAQTRTTKAFDHKIEMSTRLDPSHPIPWLDAFVKNVGIDVARELLEGVGQLEHPSH